VCVSTISATAREGAEQRRRRLLAAVKLPDGYPLRPVAAFLLLVACLVTLRTELPEGALNELHWVLAVAAIPLLPWILPLAARHVANVKAGPVELALRDLDPEQIGPGVRQIDDVAQALTEVSVTDMPTHSRGILERVKEIEAERTEVVAVDLRGTAWRLSTIYFFAFLLESRTIVRRLVFEERAEGSRSFLGMCSPRALRRSIEREHPLYRDVRKRTPLIDLDSAGRAFFLELASEADGAADEAGLSPRLDSRGIVQLLGPAFEPESLDRREVDGLPGLRRVLASERRYVAVVDGGSYQVLDRLRVALAVARRATGS
jgi:hypothetical protein